VLRRVLALALAMMAVPAVSAEPEAGEDIVVTGARAATREIEKVARAVAPAGNLYREPLARFQEAVCPGVVGLSAAFGRSVVARIRIVAERAGIRLGPLDMCRVNLLVVFLPDGQAAMQSLSRNGPWLFPGIRPVQLRDLAAAPALRSLAADPGPVHAWVNSEIRGRHGELLAGRDGVGDIATLKTPDAGWRLFMPARKDIVGSLVVIDIGAMKGVTAIQVADYAAMRGLVQTRPPGAPGSVGTILSLFDKDAVAPQAMTRFDWGYLRVIYRSSPNLSGMSKVMRVASEMKKVSVDE